MILSVAFDIILKRAERAMINSRDTFFSGFVNMDLD